MRKKDKEEENTVYDVHEKIFLETLALASIFGSYFLVVTTIDNENSLNSNLTTIMKLHGTHNLILKYRDIFTHIAQKLRLLLLKCCYNSLL